MVLIAAVTNPQEGLVFFNENIELKIGSKIIGNGKLYLSQNCLAWQDDNMPNGISIQWKEIALHGVSSDPRKCIYFMLDHKLVWRGVYEENNVREHNGNENMVHDNVPNNEDEEADDDDEAIAEEEHQITECWLTPNDTNIVDTIFLSMADLQALHRDSDDSISDDEYMAMNMEDDEDNDDDDSGYELGGSNGNDAAAANASNGIQNLNLNDRFEDAEE